MSTALTLAAALTIAAGSASAEETLKIAIGQRGGWEPCVCEPLDWLYSEPAAIAASAAWSGLPESGARPSF
ncbi:MAG TPA: hypothetical protein VLX44_03465 [Xanthobacteraceae bacterium]|nr:hypothetical protein [Xanthobacteraceae bacterium]